MSAPLELVIASANPDKVVELRELLGAALGDAVVLLERPSSIPEVEETGTTLEENALLKARAISAATGLAAISDDTGLEVHALGGAPGVYAARYAGEHATYADNVEKLLRELAGSADRSARFRTVCAVVFPDGRELLADGSVDGTIALAPAGGTGFGYDPVFIPLSEQSRTYAELSRSEKHVLSHRGAAVRAIAAVLAAELERRC